MKAGAVPVLVQLLSSKDKSIVDNAVWALGSIAGNGAECRDFTIHCGIIQPLIALVKPTRKVGQVLTLDIHTTYTRIYSIRNAVYQSLHSSRVYIVFIL